MSLWDDMVKIFDEIKAKVGGKVGAEVETDVHNIVEQGKAQAQQLLSEAGQDISADAQAVAGDASQVAADAGKGMTLGDVQAAPAAPQQ